MDGIPQTTFIPRKPVSDTVEIKPKGGMFFAFGVLVLIAAILCSAGMFAFEHFYLDRSLASVQSTLQSQSGKFDGGLIAQMTTLSNQLGAAREILSNHPALSLFFNFLADNTVSSVRFTSFSYTTPSSSSETTNTNATIALNGQAASFAALYAEENQLMLPTSMLKSPTIGSISVGKNGSVTFSVTGQLNPADISYRNEVDGAGAAASSSPLLSQ